MLLSMPCFACWQTKGPHLRCSNTMCSLLILHMADDSRQSTVQSKTVSLYYCGCALPGISLPLTLCIMTSAQPASHLCNALACARNYFQLCICFNFVN